MRKKLKKNFGGLRRLEDSILDPPTYVAPETPPVDPPDPPDEFTLDDFDEWSSGLGDGWLVSTYYVYSQPSSFVNIGGSTYANRLWYTEEQDTDIEVGSALYVNTLVPAGVIARGSNLGTSSPTYYSAVVVRGMIAKLYKVVNGTRTLLGEVESNDYYTQKWVKISLRVNGSSIRMQVYDTVGGKYLASNGGLSGSQAWAININDSSITTGGYVGIERIAQVSGNIYLDDFSILPATGDATPPTVSITSPSEGATLSGQSVITATASDAGGVASVDFYIDDVLRYTDTSSPYTWDFNTITASNGAHVLKVVAKDLAGNIGEDSINITTQNDTSLPRPNIPRHYDHIRIAQFAYSGWTLGTFEQNLLENSVDLVIPNSSNYAAITSVAPNTPQLSYTNVSNIYTSRFLDWLKFADDNGYSREDAFYHAASPQPFDGDSASSRPVQEFWYVLLNNSTDVTSEANQSFNTISMSTTTSSLRLGFPDIFRQVRFDLHQIASANYSFIVEYVSAVDAQLYPTTWTQITLIDDNTNSMQQSGNITFDPPSDWLPAILDEASGYLYFVRIRGVSGDNGPVLTTVLGSDYTNSGGSITGSIPAFDEAADLDQDGYLNDAEYANRATGKNARFMYESRMVIPQYGQMRFAVNPSTEGCREWMIDYHDWIINFTPPHGFFMDNSGGEAPFYPGQTKESILAYSQEYGSLLNTISQAIQPNWILANTAGGTADAVNTVLQLNPAYFEEFAIQAMSHHDNNFVYIATLATSRASLTSPSPIAIIDSHTRGGVWAKDLRLQLATLAYYYMFSDSENMFLMYFGGVGPSKQWDEHWCEATNFDVGQPLGNYTQFATGSDPADNTFTYRIFQRQFENARVIYKPLSRNVGTAGGTGDDTYTTHALGGSYYPLDAENNLGTAITSISLRNGEGAILIPV